MLKTHTIILDKYITRKNYGIFQKCIIAPSGKSINFIFANGQEYTVSLEYFLKWNRHPHVVYFKNKWINWNASISIDNKNGLYKKWRRVISNSAVKIYLTNDTAYIIPWDTVLMACEPRYEYYGGLTKESKKIVKNIKVNRK